MELHPSRELEGKLAAAASRRGVSVEALAHETLERARDADSTMREAIADQGDESTPPPIR